MGASATVFPKDAACGHLIWVALAQEPKFRLLYRFELRQIPGDRQLCLTCGQFVEFSLCTGRALLDSQ